MVDKATQKEVLSEEIHTVGYNHPEQMSKSPNQRTAEATGVPNRVDAISRGIYDVSVAFGDTVIEETIGVPPSRFSTGFRIRARISPGIKITIDSVWECGQTQ
jgi:hypothetical protein